MLVLANKRGRKPGFKLAWRSMTSNNNMSQSWYQDFRNLIHYARYYGNATEIRYDQLEKELQREIAWMNEKKEDLRSFERIRAIIAEKEDGPELIPLIDDEHKRKQQEHKDSVDWFTFLNLCIDEYKKWERSTKDGIIQR